MNELLARSNEYIMHPNTSKDLVFNYLNKLVPFFENPKTPLAFLDEIVKVANLLAIEIPEAQLVLGSGYPYYVLDVENRVIPEYRRFFSQTTDKAKFLNGHFACPDCISTNCPSSFRPFCNPCESPFKAMDIIRSLPDIDIIMIVDRHSDEIQRKVENTLNLNGYVQPDKHLITSIQETNNFITSVLNDEKPQNRKGRLHPDIYFLTKDEYVKAFESIAQGDLIGAKVTYVALRGKWTTYEDDFAEDLFMSRHYPPLMIRDHKLHTHTQQQVSKFVHSNTPDNIFNQYLDFLKNYTDGKNYRITTSSLSLLEGMKKRILSYYNV